MPLCMGLRSWHIFHSISIEPFQQVIAHEAFHGHCCTVQVICEFQNCMVLFFISIPSSTNITRTFQSSTWRWISLHHHWISIRGLNQHKISRRFNDMYYFQCAAMQCCSKSREAYNSKSDRPWTMEGYKWWLPPLSSTSHQDVNARTRFLPISLIKGH